jgi:pyruvate dehydrogenase E1 component alpha subunit
MNFAGVFDAPAVFLCEINAWAISLPVERQTASETLAGKAHAYGFEGIRVDGMDPLAVYETVREARESALAGDPVLVESLTYRRGAHSTSDDPDRYRDRESERPDWRTADPLDRYESFLREAGVVDASFVPGVREAAESWVAEAVETVESDSDPSPDDVFAFAYGRAPPRVAAQRRALRVRTDE